MTDPIRYDPEHGFSQGPQGVDNESLFQAVLSWHDAHMDDLEIPDAARRAHAAAHVLGESLIASDPAAQEAVERLDADGVPRHAVVHAVAEIATDVIRRTQAGQVGGEVHARLAALDSLTVAMSDMEWEEPLFDDDGELLDDPLPWVMAVTMAFEWSPEAREVTLEGWVGPLLEALVEMGFHPACLTPVLFDQMATEALPMFVDADGADAPAAVAELGAFLRFLERAFDVPWAAEARTRLESPLFERRLAKALDESPSFDDLAQAAIEAGIDLDTEEGRARMQEYLDAAIAMVDEDEEAPVAEVRRLDPNVPRSAPCPCGSGKKYKNCCG